MKIQMNGKKSSGFPIMRDNLHNFLCYYSMAGYLFDFNHPPLLIRTNYNLGLTIPKIITQ